MYRSESDPPSREEEEEVQSSSDSETGKEIESPEAKAKRDWIVSISDEDYEEYIKANEACKESANSYPNLQQRALESLKQKDKIRQEAVQEDILKYRKDLTEKLWNLTKLVPYDLQAYICLPFYSKLKWAKQLLIKINKDFGETPPSEGEREVIRLSSTEDSESESEFKSEEEEVNDNPNSTPKNLNTMDAITNCESSLSQAQKDLLETKKLERRSIRGRITKGINKLKKDLDSGEKFAVANSKANLSETMKELDKKDDEIWAFYDEDAMAADLELGETWTEKGSTAITNADKFLNPSALSLLPLQLLLQLRPIMQKHPK